jgi:hypothetical protein
LEPAAAASSLRSLLPSLSSLRVSRFRLRQLEAVTLIREERENGKQALAYNARPFVLCGLPLRPPPKDQLTYTRRNGKFFLDITGHPRFGVPFGQDRLIPIWVATLAVQQKSRIVRFDSAAQMLDFFRLSKDGRHYRRIVQGFQRVFAATIFFGTDDERGGNRIADWARFHFFERIRLWFHYNGQPAPADDTAENTITLSEAFYKEIDAHRIPVEREVIAAFANAPGVLDFYLWLVWKSWAVNGIPAFVPLFTSSGLNSQLGTRQYPARRFRQLIGQWLRKVKALWPECPAEISQDGQRLIVKSSRACPAVRAAEKAVIHGPATRDSGYGKGRSSRESVYART